MADEEERIGLDEQQAQLLFKTITFALNRIGAGTSKYAIFIVSDTLNKDGKVDIVSDMISTMSKDQLQEVMHHWLNGKVN